MAVLCRLRRCSGETRCRTGRVPLGKRSVTHPIREYKGEIFTDYYFGEANTSNKSDNYHNNAINENLNWGGISRLLQATSQNRMLPDELPRDTMCRWRVSNLTTL